MSSDATAEPAPPNTPRQGRVLVIGYGSPIRGDDLLGPMVADRLADENLPPHARAVSRHVLTPELVEAVAESARVIFIDASEDGPVGRVQVRRLQAAPQAAMAMGHFLDPRELLAWSRDLYHREPTSWLVSVRGESFALASYALSHGVEALVADMIGEVRALIDARP